MLSTIYLLRKTLNQNFDAIYFSCTGIFRDFTSASKKKPYPNIAELQIEDLIEKYHIPGVVIAIIHKDSSRIYTYGIAEKQSKSAITANTIFNAI